MTHQDFVAAWLGSKTALEVSAKTGLDTRRCANIAASLRAKGVLLPKHPAGKHDSPSAFSDRIDVQALNKFILER